ncbi:unnamed protein product [Pseudo-nitzschia multistriata]|uniref:Thioredoxin domain-containing protein n=1 Tax=Pseudo-nitzschia multistriata TaxID=183589 RepID=A0A448Z607_9STRA|nr:unnamed protein product [Pseudo-nitzschia multistriata]
MVSSRPYIRYHGSPLFFMIKNILFFVLVSNGIEKAQSFSVRPLHPPSTRSYTGNDSLLNAVNSKSIVAVTDSNYKELFSGEKFLLLDACAQWCGPCKLIEPLLEQCARDWKDTLVVGKFDVDGANSESRDLKVELILQGAMPKALPALILVHDNKILDSWKGLISPAQLQDMLAKHVKNGTKTKDNNPVATKPRPFRGISFFNESMAL